MTLISRYRHIIWDWNGTLLDDVAVCVEVLNDVLCSYGLPAIDIDSYTKGFCFPVQRFYEQLGFDFSRIPYQQVADRYIQLYQVKQAQCQLHTGATDVLQWVRRQGMTQSVLSAYNQRLLELAIRSRNLKGLFEWILGNPDHLAYSKESQGRQLLSQIGLPAKQIVLIGDTTHDYQVANSLAIDCVLIAAGHQAPYRLQRCRAPMLGSISQVPRYLASNPG